MNYALGSLKLDVETVKAATPRLYVDVAVLWYSYDATLTLGKAECLIRFEKALSLTKTVAP